MMTRGQKGKVKLICWLTLMIIGMQFNSLFLSVWAGWCAGYNITEAVFGDAMERFERTKDGQ